MHWDEITLKVNHIFMLGALLKVLCLSQLASKAVDCLLDSKWAKAKKGEEALFTTRESVVDYCNR